MGSSLVKSLSLYGCMGSKHNAVIKPIHAGVRGKYLSSVNIDGFVSLTREWLHDKNIMQVGSVIGQASSTVCRYWTGEYLEPSVFKPLACCHCYETLFRAIGHVGSGFCNYTTSRIRKSPYCRKELISVISFFVSI